MPRHVFSSTYAVTYGDHNATLAPTFGTPAKEKLGLAPFQNFTFSLHKLSCFGLRKEPTHQCNSSTYDLRQTNQMRARTRHSQTPQISPTRNLITSRQGRHYKQTLFAVSVHFRVCKQYHSL